MLDAILGNAKGIESVGEIVSGMGRYESLCSCGESFRLCPFWKSIRKQFEVRAGAPWDHAVEMLVGQAHLKQFLKTLFATSSEEWVQCLKCDNELVLHAIGAPGKRIVVDSSKEVTRALFLMRFMHGTKIIHLVRHPVNVLQSHYHRLAKGSGFKFLRIHFSPKKWFAPFLLLSAVSWVVGNLMNELLRSFGTDRFIRIRYEDLLAHPDKELERIERLIGISLACIKNKIKAQEPFSVGHNIGGNHMRMAGTFRFDPRKSIRHGLPRRYRVMVNFICWPLLWYYGYYRK